MRAIVTGHSRGLGAAIADALCARGIPVLGLSRQRHAAPSAHAVRLTEAELDLGNSATVGAWLAGGALAAFLQGTPRVILVNNAGTVQPVGPLGLQDPAAIARSVSLNVAAPLMLADAVLACSPQAAETRILHVSSGAGRNAYPGWSAYCATKAALDMHARAAEMDHVPGLKICSLAPGVIDTDMQGEIRAAALERFPMRERFETMKRDGMLATPADCARRLVAYLLSDAFGSQAVADLREVMPA